MVLVIADACFVSKGFFKYIISTVLILNGNVEMDSFLFLFTVASMVSRVLVDPWPIRDTIELTVAVIGIEKKPLKINFMNSPFKSSKKLAKKTSTITKFK